MGMSLALKDDLRRLVWRLLPGRCKVGMFGCGQATDGCEIAFPEGDMGAEGEPGKRLNATAISMTVAAEVDDRGDGTADPVDMYSGRSSSDV